MATTVEMTTGKVKQEGGHLYVEVISNNMESLMARGRMFVKEMVDNDSKYAAWTQAGVEKETGPTAFDPAQPDVDARSLIKEGKTPKVEWSYRQLFRLTRNI